MNGGVPTPTGRLGIQDVISSFTLMHWTRDNTGAYALGDCSHSYDIPLTQGYNPYSGITTVQVNLPEGGVFPTFTTTDGVTFTTVLSRGNTHGATLEKTGSEFIIHGPLGDSWHYTIPSGWSRTDNGRIMQVATIAPSHGYPISLTYSGNEIAQAQSLIGVTTYTWSTVSGYRLITAVTEPDGRTHTFDYTLFSGRPELSAIHAPDGSIDTITHDGTPMSLPGHTESFTRRTVFMPNDNLGAARTLTTWVDDIGRVALTEDGLDRDRVWRPASAITGDQLWRLFQDPDGSLHLPVFNGDAGLVARITLGSDSIDRNTLDGVKRTTATIDELGRVTAYAWEGATQQPQRIDYPDGSNEQWTRQAGTGQPLTHTDRLGRVTTWERNATGLPTSITYPSDGSSTAAIPVVQDDFIDPTITSANWAWTNVLLTEYPSWCDGRLPDLANAPGGRWQWMTYNFYSQGIDAWTNTPLSEGVRLTGGGSAGIPLYTSGGYTAPLAMRISADVSLLSASGNLVRLGFWNNLNGAGTFTGLELDGSGGLTLVENNVVQTATTVAFTGTFTPSAFRTLSYDIDSSTGAISHVTLQGSSSTYAFTSTAFTAPNYGGMAGDGGSGYSWVAHFEVDDLDPHFPTETFAYNDANQMVRHTDELGRATEFFYGLSGTAADTATWDDPANHGFLVRIDAPGDTLGTTVSTTFRWDAAHLDCVETIDPSGHHFNYTYDPMHRLIRTDWDDGSYATSTYGAVSSSATAGLLVASRDRDGRVTTYEYDASGLKTGEARPDGTRIDTTYDAFGRVATITDSGNCTTYGYDDTGRQNVVTRQASATVALTTSTTFDSRDRKVATTDPYGRITGMVYDINDRVARTVRGLVPGALSWAASQTGVDALVADTSWTSTDIGAVGLAGSTSSTSSSDVTLIAAGSGTWWTPDSFRYYSQPFPGEGSITVQIDPASTGRSGLMIRDGLGATDRFVEILIHPTEGLSMHFRAFAGPSIPLYVATPATLPHWLRLTRNSHEIIGWISNDGTTWTDVAIAPVPMDGNARAGVYQSSLFTSTLETGVFHNLAVVKTNALSSVRMAAWASYLQAMPRLTGSNPDYIIDENTYDAEGQRLATTDGRGALTTYTYDARGRVLTCTEDATGTPATTSNTYDMVGNHITDTSPRGVVTQTTYTRRNLVSQVAQAAGTPQATVVATNTYTPNGKLATMTDALGRVTTNTYSTCCDRLSVITDPLGFQTSFTYDPVGNRLTVTDGNGLTTTTTYDARNRIATISNAAGEVTNSAYDDDLTDGSGLDTIPAVAAVLPSLGLGAGAAGSAIATTDPAGDTSYDLRDGLDRTVARIDGLGHATITSYDTVAAGLKETAQTDALGHTTRQRADAIGAVRQFVDALGEVATAGFDADGNRISELDANAVGWIATFDARNRMTARSDTRTSGAGTIHWTFDADGNRLSETDALSQTETSTFDLRNRRITVTDRVGGVTAFAYDAVGNLTQISDADNAAHGGPGNVAGTTQYAYDGRNLLVADAFPAGQAGRTAHAYAYDGGGRLTDRHIGILASAFGSAPTFAGTPEATTYVYDNANRLIARGYADGRNDAFGYDHASRLTTATSQRYADTVVRAYDAAGRRTGESLVLPDGAIAGTTVTSATFAVAYAYDAADRLTTMTYPTASTVARTYTARNELSALSHGGTTVGARAYDAGGRPVTTAYGNGLTETRTYVPGDSLVSTLATAPATGAAVIGFAYAYDADRRKLTESDTVAADAQNFGYDAQARVIGWNRTGSASATQSWDLTLAGDWNSTTRDGITESRTHSAVHETTQVGGTALAYDAKGNLTTDERGTRLAWDPENRLITAIVAPAMSRTGLGQIAAYRYDALGRRIAKTVQNRQTLFLPAGAQTVVEIDRAALPQPADIASDGTLANLAQTPANGGILPGTGVTRINFQPQGSVIPVGYLADKGLVAGTRTNGMTYGWSLDRSADAVEHDAVDLPEFDTDIPLHAGSATASWSINVPDGSYPVVVVAGDATSTNQTDDLTIGGQSATDSTPALVPPGYDQGNFDGYAVQVTITGGVLCISAGTGAFDPKLCFVEIGPEGQTISTDTRAKLADLITRMNAQTGAAAPRNGTREYAWGTSVDELLGYTRTPSASPTTRYWVHPNSLLSVAAASDASGVIAERYRYDAYGQRQVLDGSGIPMVASVIAQFTGFTGRRDDAETGYLFMRNRMFSATLGRFMARDPGISTTRNGVRPTAGKGYQDGMDLYSAYFVPNATDPSGLQVFHFPCVDIDISLSVTNGRGTANITATPSTDPTCCQCTRILGRQWIDTGSTGEFKLDNHESGSDFYNFDTGIFKDKDGNVSGTQKPKPTQDLNPGDLGLPGKPAVPAAPGVPAKPGVPATVIDSPTEGNHWNRTWVTCFYCQKGATASSQGCVQWQETYDANGVLHYGIDPTPPNPTTLPGGDNPVGKR